MIVFPTLKPIQLRKKLESSCLENLKHKVRLKPRTHVFGQLRTPIWDAIWAACETEAGKHMHMKKMREK